MGEYAKKDARPQIGESAQGALFVPVGLVFSKGVTRGVGRPNDRRYTRHLQDLWLETPGVHPGRVATHHVPLSDTGKGYRLADGSQAGVSILRDTSASVWLLPTQEFGSKVSYTRQRVREIAQ